VQAAALSPDTASKSRDVNGDGGANSEWGGGGFSTRGVVDSRQSAEWLQLPRRYFSFVILFFPRA